MGIPSAPVDVVVDAAPTADEEAVGTAVIEPEAAATLEAPPATAVALALATPLAVAAADPMDNDDPRAVAVADASTAVELTIPPNENDSAAEREKGTVVPVAAAAEEEVSWRRLSWIMVEKSLEGVFDATAVAALRLIMEGEAVAEEAAS